MSTIPSSITQRAFDHNAPSLHGLSPGARFLLFFGLAWIQEFSGEPIWPEEIITKERGRGEHGP
jgi:hypothetical protein